MGGQSPKTFFVSLVRLNMRIGIDARPLSYRMTGIGVYLKNVLDEIQKSDSQNHYFLISNAKIHYEIRNPNWNKIEGNLKKKLLSTFWMQVMSPGILFKLGVAVFWGTRHHLPLFMPPRIRSVLTIHDIVYRFYPETMAPPNLLVERLLMKRSLKRADAVITDTLSTADDLRTLFRMNRARIFPIHLGKPKTALPTQPDPGSGGDLPSTFFLFVGTLDPRKNFIRIVSAFTLLGPARYDVHFLIVGSEGWKNEGFLNAVRDHPFRSYIHLKGYVSPRFLATCYTKATCLVFPSLYEGFGLPILEAMSYGTPVITSDIPVMKEVAGDAALLINPNDTGELADAMKSVLTNEELRDRLRKKGFQRIRHFSWKRCARETLNVINMLAELKGRGK